MKRANWKAMGAAAVTGTAVSVVWLVAVWLARPEGPVPAVAVASRFWWAVVLGLAAPVVLCLVLEHWSERRFAKLRLSLERLAEGQPWVRMQAEGSAAERRMAHAFNRLAEYVETTQHDLERSISVLERGLTGKARQLEQANRVLLDVANRDPLTQLANRARLEVEVERHVPVARNSGLPLAIVMLDLDHFKEYNDAAGHLAGDQLLIRVADAMRSRARATDLLSRWGGDEFCVLLPGTSPRGAQAMAQGLVDAVTDTMTTDLPDTLHVPIGASAGYACFPDDGDDAATLIALADGALYMAKAAGRGRVLRAGDDPSDPGVT
jgi:diguanylate cyclase (GGDEF)-like protein